MTGTMGDHISRTRPKEPLMMKRPVVFFVSLLLAVSLSPLRAEPAKKETPEIAAARALFAANLQAIRDKNKDAYLACYLDSESLVRTGPDGPKLGFKDLAATAGQGWPDHIEADD